MKLDKSIRFIIVSIVMLLYLFFIVVPWANSRWFFSTGHHVEIGYRTIYFFMVFPVVGAYLILLQRDLKSLEKLRSIIFPLTISTLFICFVLGLLILGGAMMWLAILLLIPASIVVIISFIVGVICDVKKLTNEELIRSIFKK